ncbi:MAG TPA: class I SAM-dependent methyltransferase [Isosphaeraceae bacterium]|nr:class I SAM-dependent methyltransferase [Isosphaeraceae bacterium]
MSYDKHQATLEFRRWSDSYDRCILQWMLFGPSHRVLIGRIRAVSRGRPIRMLDVGCGTGVFASAVRAALPEVKVVGIDLVAEMLEKGRLRWQSQSGQVFPVQGDSERLPFASASFDIVTCANSFHHYPRQDRAIEEMRRVLKPGGRLMIIDGYRDNLWGWFIYDVCVAGVEGDVRHASAARFRDLMTEAGLQAIAQRVHAGLAPFLITEGIAAEPIPVIPTPHFRLRNPVASEQPIA